MSKFVKILTKSTFDDVTSMEENTFYQIHSMKWKFKSTFHPQNKTIGRQPTAQVFFSWSVAKIQFF
jgi:hypothetical protein